MIPEYCADVLPAEFAPQAIFHTTVLLCSNGTASMITRGPPPTGLLLPESSNCILAYRSLVWTSVCLLLASPYHRVHLTLCRVYGLFNSNNIHNATWATESGLRVNYMYSLPTSNDIHNVACSQLQ